MLIENRVKNKQYVRSRGIPMIFLQQINTMQCYMNSGSGFLIIHRTDGGSHN
jgi:hypothetical protein